jgi:hypothetical protein
VGSEPLPGRDQSQNQATDQDRYDYLPSVTGEMLRSHNRRRREEGAESGTGADGDTDSDAAVRAGSESGDGGEGAQTPEISKVNTRRLQIRRRSLREEMPKAADRSPGLEAAPPELRLTRNPNSDNEHQTVTYRYRFELEQDLSRDEIVLRTSIRRLGIGVHAVDFRLSLHIPIRLSAEGAMLETFFGDFIRQALPIVDFFTFVRGLRAFLIDTMSSGRVTVLAATPPHVSRVVERFDAAVSKIIPNEISNIRESVYSLA